MAPAAAVVATAVAVTLGVNVLCLAAAVARHTARFACLPRLLFWSNGRVKRRGWGAWGAEGWWARAPAPTASKIGRAHV